MKYKCTLCGKEEGAKLVTYKSKQQLLLCSECIELNRVSYLEQRQNSEAMNRVKPETFITRPACSKIWLMVWAQMSSRTAH